MVTPAGNVLAASCGFDPDPAIQYVTRAGSVLWKGTTSDFFACGIPAITDSRDITYWLPDAAEAIDSTGRRLWRTPTGGFYGVRSGVTSLGAALGWNGSVYFSTFNGREEKVLGFDRSTGAVTLDLPIGSAAAQVFTYPNGIIVVAGNRIDYYDYAGGLLHEYIATPSNAYDVATGANGVVYFAGYADVSCDHVSVTKFTPAGLSWTWTDPGARNRCDHTFVAATPDGGVILALTAPGAADFISISPAGTSRWTHHTDAVPGTFPLLSVDVNGMVAMGTDFYYDCGSSTSCFGARVQFATQEGASASLPTLTVTDPSNVHFYMSSMAIDSDRLYAARERASSTAADSISAFVVPGLGQDYRLVIRTPDIPPPPPPPPPAPRYVALGDSVPYGHGFSLPDQDDPPSASAYPELLRQGLDGLRLLAYRTHECTLSGDQLAVSGAPSIANIYTSGDSHCGLSVFPDEVNAANLAGDPPALVTIQAGADDINFGGCLRSILGSPKISILGRTLVGAEKCFKKDKKKGYDVTRKVANELASLESGLTATIATIHRDAPNAQIVLLTYYQIIPLPNADLTGSGTICQDLRKKRKGGKWRTDIRFQADFLQAQVNNTIRGAAARFSDVLVVDLTNAFYGHEMCALDTWLFDGLHDAAHPNVEGQSQIADYIVARYHTVTGKCVGR